ncbi:MAG: HD domain-containing protein [Blautia sp.]|nr:HD domain-containing protein [Blautia sp.]MCM1219882.1 HD domain-containing protein [Lachnospiraceae bacterium]
MYKCFQEKKLAQYPFYINLHYYDSKVTEADTPEALDKKVEERMKEDLKELLELSRENNKTGFLIIIDGRDKYYRSQLNSGKVLDKIVSKIKGHKKIICLGEKTNVHSFRDREQEENLDFRTAYTFHFQSVNICKEDAWKDAVKKYCEIIDKEKEIEPINDCIERFKIKEVDYNLFTVLERCSERCRLGEVKSISDLYRRYCRYYLEGFNGSIQISTNLAYQYFMTKDMIEQGYIAEHWGEWELIHQHKTISNYLLALYYAELILKCEEENVGQLECVFTNGINVFLKSILNEKRESQENTITFCKMMFQKGGFRAQAQAAYLVGRIDNKRLKEEAKEILSEQLETLKEKRKTESDTDSRNALKAIEKEKEKEFYFLCRSILVSMLYLGDVRAGAELLDTFFRSPVMNEVNRGFYLQYYDDVRLAPERVNLEDDGRDSIFFTSGVLLNYIDTRLKEDEAEWTVSQKYEFQIHLFTLCSLVQVRLNQAIDAGILEKLCNIIEDTLENVENRLNKEMRIYLQMLQEDIENKAFARSHLYNELYKVKDIQRRGWLEKIRKGSIKKDGIEVEPGFLYENVVEHTYYAWLLGMLYLPERLSLDDKSENFDDKDCDYSKYDKKKILDGILIHDLAEVYVGDKLPDETTEEHKKRENECMRRIFMHDMYAGIAKMDDYRSIWKYFGLASSDINGKIAKELDVIQAIYQFCVYKRMGAEFGRKKEAEWKKEKEKIETRIGYDILNEVVLQNFKDIFKESKPNKEKPAN